MEQSTKTGRHACHTLCRTERSELMSHPGGRITAKPAPRYGGIVPPLAGSIYIDDKRKD